MAVTSLVNSVPIPEVVRPKPHFTPSMWGDRFSSFSIDDQEWEIYTKEIDILKDEVKTLLVASGTKPAEKMDFINTIERLGLSYHFHKEIEDQLENLFLVHANAEDVKDNDMLNTAVSFRIFRQHGYKISSDVFSKFKASNGKFDEALAGEAMGMLSLYEATHVRIHGEEILDEALAFTACHLEKMVADLNSALAKQVRHALDQPLHKGIPRVEAKHFISFYEEDPSKNELLQRFAKLDFNLVQMLHKQELSQLIRWWNELDYATKLSYARNRIVECYFWAVSVHFEPGYSLARMIFTKIVAMLSLTDDTYDSYATIEEIDLYTDAINRWDMSIIHELPDFMKICYKSLLNLVDEFDEEMTKQGRSYSIHFLKEAFKETVGGYHVEAKWFREKYVPGFDEYLANALTSTGLCMLGLASFMAMGEEASVHDFDYTLHNPQFVVATSLYGRLMDDIVDHEDEQEDITGIDCYMKEHGVSKEESVAEFQTRIEKTWKDINEELLRPTPVSMRLVVIYLNFMRMMFVTYKHEDGYTHPERHLKDYVVALFIDAIPI